MNAADVAVWVGATMLGGGTFIAYFGFWFLAIRDARNGDPESLMGMLFATIIIGIFLLAVGMSA